MKAIAPSALVALLHFAPAAAAQAPSDSTSAELRSPDGFYLRTSVSGPAFVTFFGDGPTGTATIAALDSAPGFSIGGSIAPGWVIGGTVQTATAQGTFDRGPLRNATLVVDGSNTPASQKARATFVETGLFVDWYPDPRAGWHVGLSGGLGVITVNNYADDSTLVGFSPAGTVFGGRDWAIGGPWSLGISLVASGATGATLKRESTDDSAGYRLAPVSVGLQASLLYF
jgi:hypothetical protein